jgi:hypothetical protein
MSDWIDELFECGPENDYSNVYQNSRRFAVSLCRTSTLDKHEQDELIDTLLDFDIEMTSQEIQDVITNLQLNQLDPMQFYAPSKKEINEFIKKITKE